MKRIKNKLRSQTGASISFALLLFLVCAVLCSVIIVAATAASGRMSGIAETDQRYYAVTSAAELMKDLISNKTVTLVKVTTSTETTTYTNGVAGGTVTGGNSYYITYLIPDKTAGEVTSADYTNQIDSTDYIGSPTFSTIPADAAYRYYKRESPMTITTPRFTLQSSEGLKSALGVVGNDDPLAVNIEELLDENGNITLTLYNTNGNRLKQKMVFSATVSTPVSSTTMSDSAPYGEFMSQDGKTTTYSVDTTITVTEKTTLTWKLTSVETVSAPTSGS